MFNSRKIRFASAISTIALAFGGIAVSAPAANAGIDCSTAFAGGAGTSGSPYQIGTMAQLEALTDCSAPDVYFVQTSDIALTSSYVPVNNFYGIYDGQNHKVTGLDLVATDNYYGLFRGAFGDSTLKNTIIRNLGVSGKIDARGHWQIGQLAGEIDGVTISNVHTDVAITNGGGLSGGMFGQVLNSTLINTLTTPFSCLTSYAGGDGSAASPYQVSTMAQLETLSTCNSTGIFFTQTADIALTSAYLPIPEFRGSYDGANHAVTGLDVTATDNYQGLFRKVYGDPDLKDTVVKNLYVFGKIEAGGYWQIGQLAGEADGVTITNVRTNVAITNGGGAAGDLFGQVTNYDISNSNETDQACATKGFVGFGNSARPYQVSTMGQLESIEACSGPGKYFAQSADIALTSSYVPIAFFEGIYDGANHSITGLSIESSDTYQGIFKELHGDTTDRDTVVKNLSISGHINAETTSVGGLVGRANGSTIDNVHSSVSISGVGNSYGSLAGEITSTTVLNSSASGNLNLSSENGFSSTGGLIGTAYGQSTIEHSSASGSITNGSCSTGGLIGSLQESVLRDSFATGNITGACNGFYQATGGLVGYTYNASIYRSYASGNVVGRARTGGLVGEFEDGSSFNSNESKIQDSYASGSVTSTGKAGALVGTLCSGNVLNSYAVGSVTSTESTTGGAIGAHDLALESDDCPEFSEIVSGVFWNSSTIGSTAVSPYGGATGKTTSELKTLATFTMPWSIATYWQAGKVWAICPGINSGYPVLTSLTAQASCAEPVVAPATKPVNKVKPTIAGAKKKVGAKLTAVKGTWISAATPTIAYQWYRCAKPLAAAATTIRSALKCSAIARAKSSSYKLATADKKKYIVVKVTATNATGSTIYYSKASTKIS